MAKLYTLDNKLLVETPEVRIGDRLYPVDNRTKTVKEILAAVSKRKKASENGEDRMGAVAGMDEALTLAFGEKAVREIKPDELPFDAYLKLIELTIAAVTGEEPEAVAARFPKADSTTEQPAV